MGFPAHKVARLLIADDEEGLLFLMVDVLRREGYEVEGFASGGETLEWLSHETADLLLLDLKLGDLSAPLLVDRLRERGIDIPFVIVTGHGDERTAVDVMRRGALDYVMKDAGMLELLPSIVRRSLGTVERERKLIDAYEAIRQREERQKFVIQTALDGFVRFGKAGNVLEVNEALCSLLGYSPEELIQRNVFDAEDAAFKQEVREEVTHLEAGCAMHCFTQLHRRDGRVIETEISLREDRGEVFGFVHDISEQRRLEREVLHITMEERHQFGRELHDGLGQQLTALELMTHTLARELKTAAPVQAKSAWEITKYIRQAITQTRELAHGLSPVAAEGEGLMQALQDLAQMTTSAGTPCDFECPSPVKIDDSAMAGHLYRIAQEAVTNALKHAKPAQIVLRLEDRETVIELTVEDNGCGFPRRKSKKNGMGLQVMQHRARLVGGHLSLHSVSGKGARVVCSVPKKK
ncbi:MAG TPA: response regulator [Chthoniobacter sp.]|nr:response regulator [Chthoniobacter sp.]